MKQLVAAAVIAAAALPAHAQGYLQGSGGVTTAPWLDISGVSYKMNTGYNVGVSGGLNLANVLGPSWDVRGDILYTKNEYACCRAHLGGTSFMVNLIYRFDLGLPAKPYIGAGLGGVSIQYGNALTGPNDSKVSFGGQALAGVEYPLFGRFSMFGEYRYIAAHKANIAQLGPVDYQTHNVMAGLKMTL